VPALSATSVVDILVREVNQPPVLPSIANRIVVGATSLVFTVAATDADRPFNAISYALVPGAPAGAGIDPVSGQFAWTPTPGQIPGAYTLAVTATDNGTPPLSATQSFSVVVKQRPVIDWSNPVPMVRGTPLSTNQLNAEADVPGTFTYNPPIGSVLPVGGQNLRVTLTPDNLDAYVVVTATVSVLVEPSPQAIDFPLPASVTATSVVTLTAAASSGLPVSFEVLEGPAVLFGDQLTLVSYGEVRVVARQAGDADWLPAPPVTNVIAVQPLPIAFGWPSPEPALFGAVLGEVQLNATAGVAGAFAYLPAAGAVLPAGTNILTATFTPNDLVLYAVSTLQVAWVIHPYVLIQPGELVLSRGDSGMLGIRALAGGAPYSGGLDAAAFQLQLATGALQDVALVVDPALAQIGVTNIGTNLIHVSVQALPGQLLPVTGSFVQVEATMPMLQTSRRLAVRVLAPTARDAFGNPVDIVTGGDGAIVLVGEEPLFGSPVAGASGTQLPVYVAPGSWTLEFSTNVLRDDAWHPLELFGDELDFRILLDGGSDDRSRIYRVVPAGP